MRPAAMLVALAAAMAMTACQSELYAALPEEECNEAMTVLLTAGIEASKSSNDGGKTWSLQVPGDKVVEALERLRSNGLPRSRFANLGDMFKKEGLVSTPVEERVRFVFGMSQELSETLSRFDGVVTARVHIALPNNDPLAKEIKPTSAAVFIKYRPDYPAMQLLAPVRNLVAHSVEGLAYENVSVTFVAAESTPAKSAIHLSSQDVQGRRDWWWIVVAIVLSAMAAAAALVWRGVGSLAKVGEQWRAAVKRVTSRGRKR